MSTDRINRLANQYESTDDTGCQAIIAACPPSDAAPLAAELQRRATAAIAEAEELREMVGNRDAGIPDHELHAVEVAP